MGKRTKDDGEAALPVADAGPTETKSDLVADVPGEAGAETLFASSVGVAGTAHVEADNPPAQDGSMAEPDAAAAQKAEENATKGVTDGEATQAPADGGDRAAAQGNGDSWPAFKGNDIEPGPVAWPFGAVEADAGPAERQIELAGAVQEAITMGNELAQLEPGSVQFEGKAHAGLANLETLLDQIGQPNAIGSSYQQAVAVGTDCFVRAVNQTLAAGFYPIEKPYYVLHGAFESAADFVLANRDAPASAIPIHLQLEGKAFQLSSPKVSDAEGMLWSVFRFAFLTLYDYLEAERLAAEKPAPAAGGFWPGERAMQPEPDPFSPTGFSPRI